MNSMTAMVEQWFQGKVALVTGASLGIGFGVAETLAQAGARVAVVGRSQDRMNQTAARLTASGSVVIGVGANVADPDDVLRMVKATINQFGRLDFLINSAGTRSFSLVHETSLDEWNEILGVQLTGTFLCCQAAIDPLLETSGRIVNMSSMFGFKGRPNGAAYATAKAGVVGLTKVLASELAPTVTVNAIAPGAVETERLGPGLSDEEKEPLRALRTKDIPLGRMGSPADVAAAVMYLLGPGGRLGHWPGASRERRRVDAMSLVLPKRPGGVVALVTGAGSGIGRATAIHLSGTGIPVAALDIDGNGADETVEMIRGRAGRAATYRGDVAAEADVTQLVAAIEESQGPIGILVNVAGIQSPNTRLRELSLDEWQRVIGINLTGTFLCCKAVLPGMLRMGWGRIVNTSSVLGLRGRPGTGAYATSKAALLGFTRSLALEVADKGITANAILPSMVDTNLVRRDSTEEQVRARGRELAIGRVAEADEIANAIAYLASDQATYVSGSELLISGASFIRA
jgi:NAD(P)-dependent dehydrogenase (short-subunit alcohol dehydrogenase family)